MVSAGQDKFVKLWKVEANALDANQMQDDQQPPYTLISQVKLNEVIESFCFMMFEGFKFLVVANGNLLTLILLDDGKDGSDEYDQGLSQETVVNSYNLEVL